MTQTAERTVPYEVWQREHELRLKAEQELKYYKDEFFLHRKIRQAPVLQPIARDVLDECRHVEKWGTVKAPDGSTRANFKTIAKRLHSSPATVKRHAERLEKLGLIEIHDHQGPQDESERKYIHVKEERVVAIDRIEDPEQVVPKQGGNRYICPECDSTAVEIRKVTFLRCQACGHEAQVDDTGWVMQNGHKAQNQLGFQQSKHTQQAEQAEAVEPTWFSEEQELATVEPSPENQLGYHSVDTSPLNATRGSALDELKALPIWVLHRNKEPFIAELCRSPQRAKSDDPTTWRTFDQAQAILEQSHREGWKYPYDGLMFANNGDYVFTDIDHCRDKDTGEITKEAQELIGCIDSYTEESYSSTGVHIIARAHIPRGRKHNGVEMYPDRRFFTFTGRQLQDTPDTIEERQAVFDDLYTELFPADAPIVAPVHDFTYSADDEEIVRKLKGDTKALKLWEGDREYIAKTYPKKDGTPDYSRADCALCKKISYWGAGGDVSTIDHLFRQSGLMREKWNRDDYRNSTIARAIGEQGRRAS